ncbi:MAG: peptidase, partial [Thaumarchaeota archaeon]|nr:peptidase [Nitrososphaerota archaeon]
GEVPAPTEGGLDIPNWVKNNAGWWSNGQIGDTDFVSGIQYLINKGIMKIPPTTPGPGPASNEIPSWVKNNAGWWSNSLISDQDFVSGIQYLITNNIIKITL